MNVPPEQFRSVSQSHSTIQRQMSLPGVGGRGLLLIGLMILLLGVGTAVVGGGLFVATQTKQQPQNVPSVGSVTPPVAPVDANPDQDAASTDEEADAAGNDAAEELPDGEQDAAGTEDVEPEPEPAPVVTRPAPRPAPRPVTRPRPRPAPQPVVAAPKPAPEPAPEPEPTTTEEPKDGPEGYMGLPDDLFGEGSDEE